VFPACGNVSTWWLQVIMPSQSITSYKIMILTLIRRLCAFSISITSKECLSQKRVTCENYIIMLFIYKIKDCKKLEFCPSYKQLSQFAPLRQVLVFLYLLGKQIPCKWDWESDRESCQTFLARKSSCPRWLDSTFFKNLINYQVLKISALGWLEDECWSNRCMLKGTCQCFSKTWA